MNNKAFTISFIIALLAVSMVYSYVSSTEESYKQKFGVEKSVVVAAHDIKELESLDETNLVTKSIPNQFVWQGTASNVNEFRGALAIAPIMKDEQITRTKVTQLGARTGLARQVSPGKRAVTVRVGDEQAVAKLIKPGDRVDILANINPNPSNRLEAEIRTLLQDMLVLATGKYITNSVPGILERDPFSKSDQKPTTVKLSEYTNYPNVTLEADPNQSQVLLYAELNFGGVYLVLRNNDDISKDDVRRTTFPDLVDKETAAKAIKGLNAPPEGRPAIPGSR